MAYAHKVARITLNGTMFQNSEHWSTGFYMGSDSADASPITDDFLTAVSVAWKAFFQSNSSYISTEYQTTSVRGALLNTDGKTDLASVKNHYESTPFSGGGSGVPLPPQIALVATMLSSSPRGLASKGRMFLPGVMSGVTGTGHISSAATQSIATNLKTFFTTINASLDRPGGVILASKGGSGGNIAPGISRYVTAVRVGDVYDTQRRRRNELNEVYYTTPAF